MARFKNTCKISAKAVRRLHNIRPRTRLVIRITPELETGSNSAPDFSDDAFDWIDEDGVANSSPPRARSPPISEEESENEADEDADVGDTKPPKKRRVSAEGDSDTVEMSPSFDTPPESADSEMVEKDAEAVADKTVKTEPQVRKRKKRAVNTLKDVPATPVCICW